MAQKSRHALYLESRWYPCCNNPRW